MCRLIQNATHAVSRWETIPLLWRSVRAKDPTKIPSNNRVGRYHMGTYRKGSPSRLNRRSSPNWKFPTATHLGIWPVQELNRSTLKPLRNGNPFTIGISTPLFFCRAKIVSGAFIHILLARSSQFNSRAWAMGRFFGRCMVGLKRYKRIRYQRCIYQK